ncbi:MAG: hypothetical protein LR011_10480, partial [Verrucomicrobia bacterium]|nr:hypothetical protein [Verrucomicrobiota bacterium]
RIYFDFAGYSLMAMGVGRWFGIRLTNNFLSPYTSCSMTDFWRRWHVTLSQWFRDYVYLPTGGNRWTRGVIPLLLVFFISGIWHGAGWNFILWGLVHGGGGAHEPPFIPFSISSDSILVDHSVDCFFWLALFLSN